jgi:hexosaminidase
MRGKVEFEPEAGDPTPREKRNFLSFERLLILAVLSLLISCNQQNKSGTREIAVIPKPQSVTYHRGDFILSHATRLKFDQADIRIRAIPGQISQALRTSVLPDQGSGVIDLGIDDLADIRPAGYQLQVRRNKIRITAKEPAGLFYGIQTLKQLIPANGSGKIPCMDMTDFPAFGWRGLMLDCSRTFLPKEYILNYIDRLAAIKMNVLHLHLTDDQGWRIEIKKYPELTQICSKFDPQYPGEVNGFYTQDDIREIVAYAAKSFITVVPEIEMPGHSTEIFAAYPELSCSGKKSVIFPYSKGPEVTEDILCAGNDSVFAFMEEVLSEVIALFPSEYIHIGGDEAPKTAWKKCPKCQSRIKVEGLRDEAELQSYFIRRIEKFINSKGRKLIGWDEILEGGLAENAAVMSWRGEQGGIEAARQGHSVVMSPTSHCYFDYSYETTPIKNVYSYHPVPKELTGDQSKYILGAQANMWTHIARTEPAIDAQIFPRLYALAEVLWTNPAVRDYADLEHRISVRR